MSFEERTLTWDLKDEKTSGMRRCREDISRRRKNKIKGKCVMFKKQKV